MSDFTDLMRKVHLFEEHHHKEVLKDKQEMIFKLYNGLLEELKEESNISIEMKSEKYDITISITSTDDLCVSEYEVFFNTLMFISDFKNTKYYGWKNHPGIEVSLLGVL